MKKIITILLLFYVIICNAQNIDIRKSNQGWIFVEGVLLNLAVTEIVDGELINNYTAVSKGYLIVYVEKYKTIKSKKPYLITYVDADGFVFQWRLIKNNYFQAGFELITKN